MEILLDFNPLMTSAPSAYQSASPSPSVMMNYFLPAAIYRPSLAELKARIEAPDLRCGFLA